MCTDEPVRLVGVVVLRNANGKLSLPSLDRKSHACVDHMTLSDNGSDAEPGIDHSR